MKRLDGTVTAAVTVTIPDGAANDMTRQTAPGIFAKANLPGVSFFNRFQ